MRATTLILFSVALSMSGCSVSSTSDDPPPAGNGGESSRPNKPPPPGPMGEPDPVDPTTDPNAGPCTGKPGELYELSVRKLAGIEDIPLCRFKNSVLLIVNGASHCGYTAQYKPLQALYQKYKAQGFYVLAFPSKSFNQEDSDEKTVSEFCAKEYAITFPLFTIGDVKGASIQPVYKWLTSQPGVEGEVAWNFEKFLVSREGKAVKRFKSAVDPKEGSEVDLAIAAELAKK